MLSVFRGDQFRTTYGWLAKMFFLMSFCVVVATQGWAAELMLPQTYSDQVNVAGWLMSEKLDGVRGYWDGQKMLSKNGNLFYPPKEFTQGLPPFPLEGELWGGRGRFEQTAGIVMKQQPHDGWMQIKFAIFDAPLTPGPFTERISKAEKWFTSHPSAYAFIIPQIELQNHAELQVELQRVEKLGGEGLIIRKPDAYYTIGRSPTILKVKSYQDTEATVLKHLPGKGRHAGRLGSLLVEISDGTQFKIGSGFSDLEREAPPPVGAVITFKHYGTYQSGTPKFPSFLRIRQDQEL